MPPPSTDSTSPEGAPCGRSREEKILRRNVLVALSKLPDVLVMVNESNVYTQLVRLLPEQIKAKAYQAILPEERHGLGIGSPDLVVVVAGFTLFRELKTPTGRVSEPQENWHAAARRRGADVAVWRSVAEAVAEVERMRGAVERLDAWAERA